ncbi:MAG TPA: protein-methionine-sulfoxide reductase catalytic subunit MsrP [Gammaproteobacteria bacterium]|nr:protein-methionine-sulfoxide reductase catalytic subunit MsrP [Gammaproteobacteria bacterium]
MTRKDNRIKPSEITPEDVYLNRRKLVAGAMAMGLLPGCQPDATAAAIPEGGEFGDLQPWAGSTSERSTPLEAASSFNNYYEFGTGKDDPARYADTLVTSPWSIEVTGEADRTGTYALEDILKPHALEERVYRLRCVERWSMVIPWVGFPMADLLKRFEPRSSARFVQFYTLADREQMPGLRSNILDWPYLEGLTIEEAMHPLTLAAVGMYGKVLPNQNGAPIRLVVPWKYGYKSAKSIVRISFTDERPRITTESRSEGGWTWQTAWNWYAGNEYGFYSNVNPNRAHPRWSQQVETRIDGTFPEPSIDTQLFNGYAEEVAHLYQGMDLIKNH